MAFLNKKSGVFKIICCLLVFLLVQNSLEQVQAQGTPFLPTRHNYFVDLSIPYSLPVLRGMRVYPAKPFEFDFVIDSEGKRALDRKETSLLIKYFLTCLTIPQEDLWVNLSPYESGRIIPDELALTNAGNTLLEQDKLLKQLASSLTYPESRLGKKFWEQIYKKAREKFGTTDLAVNTYNKVWIVPERAVVYDMGDSAMVGEAHLKVMLDEDYLAFKKHSLSLVKEGDRRISDQGNNLQQTSAEITREIILPELEKEINEGKNFAPVRQIFHSMVLAAWFKRALKRNVLSHFYVNKKKISGIDGVDKNAKEEIYKQYLRIYKAGAYNYIREDVDPISQQVVSRKYFSGGLFFGDLDRAMSTVRVTGGYDALKPYLDSARLADSFYAVAKVKLNPIGVRKAADLAQVSSGVFTRAASIAALAVTLYVALPGGSAQAAPTAPAQLPAASEHVLRFPDRIAPSDLGDIQKIKAFVRPEDVMALNQGSNPQTHKKYHVDISWMERNWNASFARGNEGRVLEAIIVAAQHKLHLPEDGQLGPDTRKALEAVNAAQPPAVAAATVPAPETPAAAPPIPMPKPAAIATAPAPEHPVAPVAKPVPVTSKVAQAGASVPLPPPASPVSAGAPPPLHPPTLPVAAGAPPPLPAPFAPAVPLYSVSQQVRANHAIQQLVGHTPGYFTGDPNKWEYLPGQRIFTLEDPVRDKFSAEDTKELRARLDQLGIYLRAFKAGATTGEKVDQTQQLVEDARQKLIEDNIEKGISTVRAWEDMVVTKFLVPPGSKVSPGTPLLNYYNPQRFRVVLVVPKTVKYLTRIENLKINGNPVSRFFISGWGSYPGDETKVRLDLLVEVSSPLQEGPVEVSADIYPPDKYFKTLDSIVGSRYTFTKLNSFKESMITAPVTGSVIFFHPEGIVQKGDILVQLDPKPYQAQLRDIDQEINGLTRQIREAATEPDGTVKVDLDDRKLLEIQKIEKEAQRAFILEQIALATVRAPGDGYIDGSAAYESRVFKSGDRLFRFIPIVMNLGDDPAYRIIFQNQQGEIRRGDAFVVQTPQGYSLPAVAVFVDSNPTNASINLGKVQAVELLVFDPKSQLRPGIVLKVIRPTPKEEPVVQSVLPPSLTAILSSTPPVPDKAMSIDPATLSRRLFVGGLPSLLALGAFGKAFARSQPPLPQAYFPSQKPSLNSMEVTNRVLANVLVGGAEAFEVLERKAMEELPGAWQLSVFANVIDNNGRFSFSGGAQAAGEGLAGAVSTGNAIGAGLPIVTRIVSNLIDYLDGKIAKEKGKAATETQIAYYHWLTVLYQQVYEAEKLLIDIGAAQQRIAQLKGLMAELTAAQNVMTTRLNLGGLSTSTDQSDLSLQINSTAEQIKDLEREMRDGTVKLNVFIGKDIPDLSTSIFDADLPWEGTYPTISSAKQEEMLANLTAENSLNTQLQEDLTARKAMQQTAALQGLEQLPRFDITGLYSTQDPSKALYNLVPGEVESASGLREGSNGIMGLQIPIIDEKLAIEQRITAFEARNTEDNIKRTKLKLAQQLDTTVNDINSLSAQILQAQEAYRTACDAWQLIAADAYHHLTSDPDSRKARIQMDKSLGDLVALKADYLKAEAYLRQMRLLSAGETLVTDLAMLTPSASFGKLALMGAIVVMLLGAMPSSVSAQQESVSPNQATENQPTENLAQEWTSIQGAPNSPGAINAVNGTLVADDDIQHRRDAVDALFMEYRKNPAFITSLENSFRTSPFPDVRKGIIIKMVELKDHNLPFFIQIAAAAAADNNEDGVAQALEGLNDVFMNDPTIIDSLSETDFYTDQSSAYSFVTPQTVRKVLLTLINADPQGFVATRLLSNQRILNPAARARIYNQLMTYVNDQPFHDPRTERIGKLAEAINDSIFRDKAKQNVDDVISLGLYDKLPPEIVTFSDPTDRAWIQALGHQNKFLLNTREWRKHREDIQPDLRASAEKISEELIAGNQDPSKISGLPFYDFSPTPIPNDLFMALDSDGQRKYVEAIDDSNISELARLLGDSQTETQEAVLSRLMKSRFGRLSVLDVYGKSKDPVLLGLIDSLDWRGYIKQDVPTITDPELLELAEKFREDKTSGNDAPTINDPAANGIYHRALDKMYARNKGEEWIANQLLSMYPLGVLHSDQVVKDPRGDALRIAQIQREAIALALKTCLQSGDFRPTWSIFRGFVKRGPDELDALNYFVNLVLDPQVDPRAVVGYLDNEKALELPGNREIFKRIKSQMPRLVERITNNDQSLPRLPKYLTYAFALLIGISAAGLSVVFNFWGMFNRRGSVAEETDKLEKSLWGKNGNGANGNTAFIAPLSVKDTYKPSFGPLESWRKLVNRWSQQGALSAEDMLNDFNVILNNTSKLTRLMPYSPELAWSDENQPLNEDYRGSYDSIFVLANRTLDALEKRLQSTPLTEDQRQQLLLDKDTMIGYMRYVTSFLTILKYRSTIEKVMSYKFSDTHLRERIYPLARWAFYYAPLLNISHRKFEQELRGLLDEGNSLMDGLYDDPGAMVTESRKKLDDVITQGKTSYNPQSKSEGFAFKVRSFNSRMWGLMGGPGVFFLTVVSWLLGFATFGLTSALYSTGVMAMTFFIFWKPHIASLQMQDYKRMAWLSNERDNTLNQLLDPSGDVHQRYQRLSLKQQREHRIEDLAIQEGREAIAQELAGRNARSVDMIVIISEDGGGVNGLGEHVDRLRERGPGQVIRNDVPVEVMGSSFKGSANGYFEALLMAKKKFEEGEYRKKYLHLKSWEDARILFIFHGKEAVLNNTLIDWSIANGYRAAASMSKTESSKEGHKGGNIIIFSRDVYFGPVQQVPGSDISIATARVSYPKLKNLGFVRTNLSENGRPDVEQILEKMDFDKLKEKNTRDPLGSRTWQFFEKKLYDLDNLLLNQYSALRGEILMGPGAVAMNLKIARRLEESGLMATLPLHLVGDLIIPVIKGKNPNKEDWLRDMIDYARERGGWADMSPENLKEMNELAYNRIAPDLPKLCDAIAGAVGSNARYQDIANDLADFHKSISMAVDPYSRIREAYTIIRDALKPDIKILAHVPHPGAEVYIPNITKGGGNIAKLLPPDWHHSPALSQASDRAAVSPVHKSPGGIDLNFQPRFIQHFSQASPDGIPKAVVPNMPDGFKGFNFNIVRFTSQLTVNGAFQLMFNSDQG